MSDNNYAQILRELESLKTDMNNKLDKVVTEIKNEMKLKHQAIEFGHEDHEKRLSSTEKIIVFIAGAIGLSLIGAFLKLVIL